MELLEKELSSDPMGISKHGAGSELLTGYTREDSL